MALIKNIEKQIRIEKGKVVNDIKEKDKEIILNYIISYYDHNGRVRHHTEDELRKNLDNITNALKEFDNKKLSKGEIN